MVPTFRPLLIRAQTTADGESCGPARRQPEPPQTAQGRRFVDRCQGLGIGLRFIVGTSVLAVDRAALLRCQPIEPTEDVAAKHKLATPE
jgi:hypothetical protein